jgi:hypothetical protein
MFKSTSIKKHVEKWREGKKRLRSFKNLVIDSYLRIYETVEKKIKDAEREIERAGNEYEEVKFLTRIVRMGMYSTQIIFSEIEESSRFSKGEKAFSYAR